MRKNKLTTTQRKAAAKRALKRANRLKKTQREKHIRKEKILADKKSKEKKFKEAMDKILSARYSK